MTSTPAKSKKTNNTNPPEPFPTEKGPEKFEAAGNGGSKKRVEPHRETPKTTLAGCVEKLYTNA